MFVGREAEMARLRAALEAAGTGQGGVVLLAGEPGIGKTRTAEELGLQAIQQGMQVLWGRCYEGGGAPAFWPWVQVLRAYLRTGDAQTLLTTLPGSTADLARLLPEISAAVPPQASAAPADEAQARFRLFESVTMFLLGAAQRQPLVLILDDLQWADTPSCLLLQFLAQEVRQSALLIIGAYRDVAVGPDHPLLTTLAALHRFGVAQVITLGGLAMPDVAHLLAVATGQTPTAALLTTILSATAGNPFFLCEVVHLLQHTAAQQRRLSLALLPPTVRGAIRQRLQPLSAACQQVLRWAAVLGHEFRLTWLAQLGDLSPEALLTSLDEACNAQLITLLSGVPGQYGFVHDLVRETLYAELPTADRARLHQRVGEMLEAFHTADLEAHLAVLSYHFSQAAPLGAWTKALQYTVRAAEQHLQALAYEEASRHYARALEVLALQETAAPSQRCDLLLALGQAQTYSGATAQARETFAAAAAVARHLHDAPRLAQAALGWAGGMVRPGVADDRLIALLTEALAALGEADSPLRVRLLGRLAMEHRFSPRRALGETLSHEAVAIARRLRDRATLVVALTARHYAILAPDTLEQRLAISTELEHLALEQGDGALTLHSLPWRVADLLGLGHVQAADDTIAQAAQFATTLRQPLYLWYVGVCRALRALMHGQFAAGERLAQAAYVLGHQVQPDAAEVYWAAQRFMVYWEQGRLADLEATLTDLAGRFPAMPVLRCMRALLLWHVGRSAEAQAELAQLCANQASALPWDQLWLGAMVMLAELAIQLTDHRHATLLYDLLLPFAHRNVMVSVPNCFGAAATYLGGLATLLRRWDVAAPHFEAGLHLNAQLGMRPFVARTQARYGALLLQRAQGTDRAQALEYLAQAQATAKELGMSVLLEQLAGLLHSDPASPPLARRASANPAGLTARELEVLRLIAAGHSTKAMAATLFISVPTVERHITHLYAKLGVHGRAEATAYAMRHGLT